MAPYASCLALAALLLVACAFSAAATSYTVGDASGWTTGVDYTNWAGRKPFKVGDNLVFDYARGLHTVVEVSAPDYLACAAANPLDSDSSGATTVALKTAGKHYFICSIPGHCGGGMKLEVDVSGSSSGAGSSSPPPPPTPTPTTPYTTPTPTTPYTTPTSPSCSGSGATPVTPGTTPIMAYSGAAGLAPLASARFGLVCVAIVHLAISDCCRLVALTTGYDHKELKTI